MSAETPGLTACIITKNEERRIGACLDSLSFCDEVLVVDSHSTDRTRELAAEHGARVIERDWPGFGPQKDFAVRAATNDWVLCLDADESLSPKLRRELEALQAAGFPDHIAWRMPRCSSYLGRWIRHGTWYPDRQLRLFDRRHGGWNDRKVHELVEVQGPVGTLDGELMHVPYEQLSDHLATIDRYTTLSAHAIHERGRRVHVWNLVLNPGMRFLRFYVFKLGLLEGWRGFLLACLAAHYVRLKYAKALILQSSEDQD